MIKRMSFLMLVILAVTLALLRKNNLEIDQFGFFNEFRVVKSVDQRKCKKLQQGDILKRLGYLERAHLYQGDEDQKELDHYFKDPKLKVIFDSSGKECELEFGEFNFLSFLIPIKIVCGLQKEIWLMKDHSTLEGLFKSERDAKEKLFSSLLREIKHLCFDAPK